MRLTQFGETPLPELNGQDDFSQSARTNLIPLKYGAIDLDNSEVVLNYKQVTRTAVINTDFDDTMDDLAYESQKGARVLKAEMRDGTERQLLAKMSMFSRGAKAQNYTCEQEFGLQWTSTYPYWLLTEHEPYYTNHGYTTGDGLSTGDANYQSVNVNSSSVNFTIDNTCRVRIPKLKFVMLWNTSDFAFAWSNIRITNNTNLMYMDLQEYIEVGSIGGTTDARVDIETLSKKIFASAPNNFSGAVVPYNQYQNFTTNPSFMDWMILEPGENEFTVTSTLSGVGTATLNVHWSNHYV